MPSPATTDLPIPKSWDEFEDIVADVLKARWRDPNVTRNGRNGQQQHGVDIFGLAAHLSGRYAGAQCKRFGERLDLPTVKKVVQEATSFQPPLGELLVATTAKRDARLQEVVRVMNARRLRAGKFPVHVLFWEDLCLDLVGDPRLLAKHFAGWSRVASTEPYPRISIAWAVRDDRPDPLVLHSQAELTRLDSVLQPFEEELIGYIAEDHPEQALSAVEYNDKVTAALADESLVASWLDSQAAERFKKGLSCGLAIRVDDAEARDILVELTFPPELEVWKRGASPSRDEPPGLPEKPRLKALEYANPLGAIELVSAMRVMQRYVSIEPLAVPVLRFPRRGLGMRVRGGQVRFSIDTLAPRREVAFEGEGEEIVIASRVLRSESLVVRYSVDAVNLPRPIEGELRISVTPGVNPAPVEDED